MWSFFPSFCSQFRPNDFFQPYLSQSSAAFRPLTRGQWLTPPAFRPRSHMLPKVHICWMNQWCGGGFQIEWTFPLLRGLPTASLPPQSSRSWSVVFRSEEKSCPGLCCQRCQREGLPTENNLPATPHHVNLKTSDELYMCSFKTSWYSWRRDII